MTAHQHVTDAELTVLEFLWETEPATKREIVAGVYPSATESDRATVQKLLERLESKGYIRRDRSGRAHIFRTAVPRTVFAGQQLEAVAQKMSGGSLFPLLLHLVETRRLSASERDQLRNMLEKKRKS